MSDKKAFSLVEVTLALGVISFGLLAILALLPVGTRSARESIDATKTSLIAQEVNSRMRAHMTSVNAAAGNYRFEPYPTGVASFFFFTSEGQRTGELIKVPFSNDMPSYYGNVRTGSDFYRAKVTVSTFDQTPGYPTFDPRLVVAGSTTPLLCATVEIASPVDTQNGNVIGTAQKTIYTLFVRKP